MRIPLSLASLLLLSVISGIAQQAKSPAIPESLKPAFEILSATYSKIDAKKTPKAPADSSWLLRSSTTGVGTVEVGFQGSEVVYMVFRRGPGGKDWTADDITAIQRSYTTTLLNERYLGEFYTRTPDPKARTYDLNRLRYGDGRIGGKNVSTPNNAAFIARKDFDITAFTTGL